MEIFKDYTYVAQNIKGVGVVYGVWSKYNIQSQRLFLFFLGGGVASEEEGAWCWWSCDCAVGGVCICCIDDVDASVDDEA